MSVVNVVIVVAVFAVGGRAVNLFITLCARTEKQAQQNHCTASYNNSLNHKIISNRTFSFDTS